MSEPSPAGSLDAALEALAPDLHQLGFSDPGPDDADGCCAGVLLQLPAVTGDVRAFLSSRGAWGKHTPLEVGWSAEVDIDSPAGIVKVAEAAVHSAGEIREFFAAHLREVACAARTR